MNCNYCGDTGRISTGADCGFCQMNSLYDEDDEEEDE